MARCTMELGKLIARIYDEAHLITDDDESTSRLAAAVTYHTLLRWHRPELAARLLADSTLEDWTPEDDELDS